MLKAEGLFSEVSRGLVEQERHVRDSSLYKILLKQFVSLTWETHRTCGVRLFGESIFARGRTSMSL